MNIDTDLSFSELKTPSINRLDILSFILNKFVPDKKNKKLLDIATGHGKFSILSNKLGFDVTAIDARDIRFPKNQNDIKWIKQELEELNDFNFDVILMLGILYHLTLDDQLLLFEKIKNNNKCKLLIIDTHICMSIPSVKVNEYEGKMFGEVKNQEDIKNIPTAAFNNVTAFWPTKESLRKMIVSCGYYELYEIVPYHYPDRTFFIAIKK